MALLVGFGVLIATGINFAPSFLQPQGHALVQPLSRKAMAVTLSRRELQACLFRACSTASYGEWRKLAERMDDCRRRFRALVHHCFSVCEGAPEDLGQLVDGGVGNEQSAGGAQGILSSQTFRGSLGRLTKLSVLDDPSRCRCLPIPFFFFTAHWLLHLKGAGIQSADATLAMGLFTSARSSAG